MKKLFYTILFIGQLIQSQTKEKWIYSSAKDIQDEIRIVYELKYDQDLVASKKTSAPQELVVTFNNRFLSYKEITNQNDLNYTTHTIYDYKKENIYQCINDNGCKIYYKNKLTKSKTKAVMQLQFKDILGYQTDEYVVQIAGKMKKLYTTKDLGINFCPHFSVEGFCLEYPFENKYYGTGMAVAKKIETFKSPKDFFSWTNYQKMAEGKIPNCNIQNTDSIIKNDYVLLKNAAPKIAPISLEKKYMDVSNRNNNIKVLFFTLFDSPLYTNEREEINQLIQSLDNFGVQFMTITPENKETVNSVIHMKPLNSEIITNGNTVLQDYKVLHLPIVLVINKEGVIVYHQKGVGKINIEIIKNEILKLHN